MKNIYEKLITIGLCSAIVITSFNTVLAAKPENVGNSNSKPVISNPPPPTVIEQIQAEQDYIINSSFTNKNVNYRTWNFLSISDAVYGSINVNRLGQRINPATNGWVKPGESAMAVVGMMQGTVYLKAHNQSITNYDYVIDQFFLTWVLAHTQGQNNNSSDPDYGAYMDRVYYNADGSYASQTPLWKTDVTAQMMIANWKYYEYNVNTGQSQQASDWIGNAWPIQQKAADYLVRMHDTTPAGTIHMLPGNSSVTEYNTWIHFASNAVPALRSASAWAKKISAPYADYDRVADDLVVGIQSMKDTNRPNYFKYRPYENGLYGAPIYGDSIDQLTFSPYETGAVTVDSFASQISDWWTNGDAEIKMTYQINDPSDWKYYGTHWHYYFDGRTENNYLYPGPGFQLAKVEWKYGNAFANPTYTTRSDSRLTWGKEINYSSLWWFLTGQKEANVSNGFQDWRDATNYSNTAEMWARFVDTSSYFIETLLMNEAGIDTNYNPVMP